MSSSVSPSATRSLNSGVFAWSSASDSFSICGSSALISRTVFWYCLSSRWLRLPKIWVSNDMLEFLKKTPQKEARMISKIHQSRDRLWQKDGDFIMRSGHNWGLYGQDNKCCREKKVVMRTAPCMPGRKPRPAVICFALMHIYGNQDRARPRSARPIFCAPTTRMASLLPTAMRMASLQKDCADALPPMFAQLRRAVVRGRPAGAGHADARRWRPRLKQQLPKLQADAAEARLAGRRHQAEGAGHAQHRAGRSQIAQAVDARHRRSTRSRSWATRCEATRRRTHN